MVLDGWSAAISVSPVTGLFRFLRKPEIGNTHAARSGRRRAFSATLTALAGRPNAMDQACSRALAPATSSGNCAIPRTTSQDGARPLDDPGLSAYVRTGGGFGSACWFEAASNAMQRTPRRNPMNSPTTPAGRNDAIRGTSVPQEGDVSSAPNHRGPDGLRGAARIMRRGQSRGSR